MTFTKEEEDILKLMVAEVKARGKISIAREQEMATAAPLQQAAQQAQQALVEKCR